MSMNRSKALVVVGVLFAGFAAAGLYRAGAAAAAPTSVAIVDVERVLAGSAEWKARNDAIQKVGEPLMKELTELSETLTSKRKELELLPKDSKEYVAKFVEAKKIEAQLEANSKLYQNVTIDLQKAEMLRDAYQSVLQAVERVSKQEGFQLVLLDDRAVKIRAVADWREAQTIVSSKRVLYADDTVDITTRVLTDMNNAYNAPAPKSTPAPAAKPK